MATVIPTHLVSSISGKTSRRSNTYYRTNRRTGKVTAVQRDEKQYHQNNSASQRACQAEFRERQRIVDEWLAAQEANPDDTYYTALADFRVQHSTPFFRSFLHRNAEKYGIIAI